MKTTTAIQLSPFKVIMNDYARYNNWANNQLTQWLQSKPEDLMEQKVLSSFTTIKATIIHILETQVFWMNVLGKESKPGDTSLLNMDEVMKEWGQQSGEMAAFIEGMDDAGLTEEVLIETPWFTSKQPRYELIQHCMNHSTYHRGQIITMGRNLGLTDAPMTDFNYYLLMEKK